MLYLENENVELLKKVENKSKLVNDLLTEHFGNGADLKTQEIENKISELKKEIIDREAAIKNLTTNLIALMEKEQAIKEKYKNIPTKILHDFKVFPKMDEASLKNRYDNYWKIFKVSYEEILEAFKEFKNGN